MKKIKLDCGQIKLDCEEIKLDWRNKTRLWKKKLDCEPPEPSYKMTDKSVLSKNLVVRHVTRPSPFMATSVIIKITRDQYVNTFTLIGSQLVVMVLRAQWPLGTIAQIFHFVAEEKKKTTEKQRHFMTGLPQVSQ